MLRFDGQVAIGKAAQLGLMNTLTANTINTNIRVNIISSVAATRVYTGSVAQGALRPEQVAPGVAFLASSSCNVSGIILRACDGRFSTRRWQIGPEIDFGVQTATLEDFAAQWEKISTVF